MTPLLTASKITLYLDECISLFDMEDGVKTIGDFVVRTEKLSLKFGGHDMTETEKEKLNSFKGDMLEILAEIFFRIFPADPAVGVISYQPVPLSEDFGVDGVGINVNGDQCVVQDKYRANPLEVILYTDIAKTYTAGKLRHNMPLDKDDTILLFTTATGVTPACQEVFGNKLRVINRKIISSYIDNNQTFWQQAEELILFTLDNL